MVKELQEFDGKVDNFNGDVDDNDEDEEEEEEDAC